MNLLGWLVAAARPAGELLLWHAHRRPDPGVDGEDDDTTPIGDPDDDEGYDDEDDEDDDDEDPLQAADPASAGPAPGRIRG